MAMKRKRESPNKRNVLLVTGVFPPGIGGMQQYYWQLCRATGHRMTVLAPVYGADAAYDEGQPYRVIRRRFLRGESVDVRSWPRLVYYTVKTIRERQAEVTIYGHVLIGLIGLLLQVFRGKKYVVSVHGKDLLEFGKFRGLTLLRKLILRRADGVLANSMFAKRVAAGLGVPERKIQVVYPGVDASFERGAKNADLIARLGLDGKFVLLTVGRLVRRKGHDMVIRSLSIIRRHIPEAVYVIVGDGPERTGLERLAEREGVAGQVVFAGAAQDTETLKEYYRTADVFVMTSRHLEDEGDVEGFGIVYLEAASCGLPAVAGRAGGVAEAVVDGVTGLLVDPVSVREITDAIVKLHGNPRLRKAFAQAAYRRAKLSFQYEQIVRGMDAFLESVCFNLPPDVRSARCRPCRF